jgi:alpha-1,6-mannosyltransferase
VTSGGPEARVAGRAPAPTPAAAGALNHREIRQLRRLRRWGTTGTVLMALGSTSSYGAANPIPNPVDGTRILSLLSRVGPAALACSYSGIALLVLSWFLLGRLAVPGRPRRLSRTQLWHTLVMWTVPLLVTPPIFSRDVYSYLAIGSMMVHGHDPYAQGPADALGEANPLAHQVDGRWQHTSTPYGPAFLLVMKAVVLVTGDHVLRGVLLARAVELIGVALIVWALPRLARHCGVDPVAVLWLGALNPLLLFHLVAGAHNEALMIGLMLAGLVVGIERSAMVGAALIAAAVGIKVTAVLAPAFLAILLARRRGGRWPDLLAMAAVIGAVAAGVFALLSWAAGYGIGWLAALGTPGTVRSFLSVTTSLGVAGGQVGLLLGLGDATDATVDTLHPVGTALAAAAALALMWRSWRGRIQPVLALGIAMGAFVLLGPVIQPWYLLWAALPLAASTSDGRYRRVTVWLTVVYAVIIMPNGATIPVFAIVQSVLVAAVVAAAVLILLVRRGMPTSRPVDDAPARDTAAVTESAG